MSFMTNILRKGAFSALAVGVALALSPLKAEATTIDPPATPAGAAIEYLVGFLANDNFVFLNDINVRIFPETQIEGTIAGSGSLTVGTFVDPFISSGAGTANLLLGATGALPLGAVVTAQWGTGPVVDLTSGGFQSLSTVFASNTDVQNLVVSWEGLNQTIGNQLSIAIAPVPLPAGGLLLLTALGGLAVARRRKAA